MLRLNRESKYGELGLLNHFVDPDDIIRAAAAKVEVPIHKVMEGNPDSDDAIFQGAQSEGSYFRSKTLCAIPLTRELVAHLENKGYKIKLPVKTTPMRQGQDGSIFNGRFPDFPDDQGWRLQWDKKTPLGEIEFSVWLWTHYRERAVVAKLYIGDGTTHNILREQVDLARRALEYSPSYADSVETFPKIVKELTDSNEKRRIPFSTLGFTGVRPLEEVWIDFVHGKNKVRWGVDDRAMKIHRLHESSINPFTLTHREHELVHAFVREEGHALLYSWWNSQLESFKSGLWITDGIE